MFRNKLKALRHPYADTIDTTFSDDQKFASTVYWLEDQRIRLYLIKDREGLSTTDDNTVWLKAYEQYKNDIGVPQLATRCEELEWLLGHAIRLEYMDRAGEYKTTTAAKLEELKKEAKPTTTSKSAIDAMNMNSEDFEQGVRKLANLLNIPHHPDHLKLLEAAAKIIDRQLNGSKYDDPKAKTVAHSLDSEKYAFDNKDVDRAAKILRLLQIHHTRDLQTAINETIVRVQELTADPKTDTKLGKVGF